MTRCSLAPCLLAFTLALFLAPAVVVAQDYTLEALKEAAPDDLPADITAQLSGTGYKVMAGKRTLVEIWPAKSLAVKGDFKPSDTIVTPLEPGSLVGALRFARKGVDFRGQDIAAGSYTLRYANQPVDGNHVGTFATRDFLLMVPGEADNSPDVVKDEKELNTASARAAESNHPAIMPLLKPGETKAPSLVHHEESEWWTLRFDGQDSSGKKVPLEVIVVGKAAE